MPVLEAGAREAAEVLLQTRADRDPVPPFQVTLKSGANPKPMRGLGAAEVSKLIKVQGIIISASATRAKATMLTLQCRSCRHTKQVPVNTGMGGAQLPRKCDKSVRSLGLYCRFQASLEDGLVSGLTEANLETDPTLRSLFSRCRRLWSRGFRHARDLESVGHRPTSHPMDHEGLCHVLIHPSWAMLGSAAIAAAEDAPRCPLDPYIILSHRSQYVDQQTLKLQVSACNS